jgi:hypothetical protein
MTWRVGCSCDVKRARRSLYVCPGGGGTGRRFDRKSKSLGSQSHIYSPSGLHISVGYELVVGRSKDNAASGKRTMVWGISL